MQKRRTLTFQLGGESEPEQDKWYYFQTVRVSVVESLGKEEWVVVCVCAREGGQWCFSCG